MRELYNGSSFRCASKQPRWPKPHLGAPGWMRLALWRTWPARRYNLGFGPFRGAFGSPVERSRYVVNWCT